MTIKPLSQEQREKIGDRRIVASVSGGKDSTALSLWLTENEVPHDRVFVDTSWEQKITYDYLRGELQRAIGPIQWVKAPLGMVELILKKGMFPSHTIRFCTQELKVKPMIQYFSDRLDEGTDCINAVGIRAGESRARSLLTEWEWNPGFDVETWRPLLEWTEDDVIEMIKRHNVPPNPLYLMGASRVGCWPCIFARKNEVRFVAEKDPGRIDLIEKLEEEVRKAAELRKMQKGEALTRIPTFFQAKGGDGACLPIRKVVEWSKTKRGGKEFVEIAQAPEGCVRWGLCGSTEVPNED